MSDHSGCPECGEGFLEWMGAATVQGDDDQYADIWRCQVCRHSWTDINPDLESEADVDNGQDDGHGEIDYPAGDFLPPEYGLSDLPF